MSNVPRLLGSSVDPNKVALTVKGLLTGLIPVIIIIAKGFSIQLDESTLVTLIELISGIVAGVMVVYGLGRKVVVWYQENFNKS